LCVAGLAKIGERKVIRWLHKGAIGKIYGQETREVTLEEVGTVFRARL